MVNFGEDSEPKGLVDEEDLEEFEEDSDTFLSKEALDMVDEVDQQDEEEVEPEPKPEGEPEEEDVLEVESEEEVLEVEPEEEADPESEPEPEEEEEGVEVEKSSPTNRKYRQMLREKKRLSKKYLGGGTRY